MIMATSKQHSPKQAVRRLMTADRLLAEAKDLADVCRQLGVSVEGDRPAAVLSPQRRRAALHHLVTVMTILERFACRVVDQQQSTQRQEPASTMLVDPDAAPRAWG